MTQKAAASLSSSLFARKGKASPASLLISEMEAANGAAPSGKPAANGSARRKPKAQADLPLLAFVEAQTEPANESESDGEALAAAPNGSAAEAGTAEAPKVDKADLPPAASLLDRGARPLRRANGRKPGMPEETAATARDDEDTPPVVQADRRPTVDDDADEDERTAAGDDETLEAETVSGDANVAAIEDASDEDVVAEVEAAPDEAAPDASHDTAVIVEAVAAPPPAAEEGETVVVPPLAEEKPAAESPAEEKSAGEETVADAAAETRPAEETQPPAAVKSASQDKTAAAITASMALRHAKTLSGDSAPRMPSPAAAEEKQHAITPRPRVAGQPSRSYLWRGAAVVVLGAALGFGAYLVFAGKPAEPPAPVAAALPQAPAEPAPQSATASAPETAAPQAAEAVAPVAAEAALPEPSFDIIRIEPDGQSIIAGRADPFSEWILLNNGTPIASVKADVNGEWVVLPDASLVPGANAFSLVPKTERGKVAIPAPDAAPQDAPAPLNAPANEAQVPAQPRSEVQGEAPGVQGRVEGAPLQPSAAELAGLLLPKPKPLLDSAAADPAALPARIQVSADGAYEVQLASVRQSADAARERDRLASVFPQLLGGLDLRVQEAAVEGAGIFYRVRSGGIADLGLAREICRQLEAGGQGCLVVRRDVEAAPPAPVTELVEEVPAEPALSAAGQQAERPQ